MFASTDIGMDESILKQRQDEAMEKQKSRRIAPAAFVIESLNQ
jgi:hypothetical protein